MKIERHNSLKTSGCLIKLKKVLVLLLCVVIVVFCGCSTKKINFIETENGKKQYKNEDGILVKNDWVEIAGDKYYFDLNGYLIVDDWVQNEYYVDKNGKMKTDYWYNDEKNEDVFYYFDGDGKNVKNKIIEIGNKKYAFDKKGKWIKNDIYITEDPNKIVLIDSNGIVIEDEGVHKIGDTEYFVNNDGYIAISCWKEFDNKKAYFNENGKRVYADFAVVEHIKSTESEIDKWCYLDENGDIVKNDYIKVDDLYYCAGEDGILLQNQWDEYEGKKYYYGSDCYMLKNQMIDGEYYVDENGEMVTNKEVAIDGKTYVFGNDGKGNIKIIKKTSNDYWKIGNYSDTGNKYLTNKYYFIADSENTKFDVIVDKDDFRIRIYWRSSGNLVKKTEDNVKAIVQVNNDIIINLETVYWDRDGYIIFNNNQRNKLINAMKNDSNKLIVVIGEHGSGKTYSYGTVIEAKGFNEIYQSLF